MGRLGLSNRPFFFSEVRGTLTFAPCLKMKQRSSPRGQLLCFERRNAVFDLASFWFSDHKAPVIWRGSKTKNTSHFSTNFFGKKTVVVAH